tara:strand:- start:332 stop:1912 length:1581 start_codon:yes stop_codon:yes gene_type:complete
MTNKRKLAAIVFTDIVGFTNLTAKNQQKASDLLDIQRDLLKPLVKSYGGKWVKEMGDGLILTFDTVNNAVECCLSIQNKAKKIDDLVLRIGIHLGEILEKENDIIGDDVNVTARIEPFSAPGGIAISNKIHDAIIREDGFDTKYLGKPKLKGVGQEVKVYCITSHGLPETVLSDVSAKLEPEGSQWNFYSLSGAVLTILGILFWINLSFFRIGLASNDKVPSISILVPDNMGDSVNDKWMNFLTENIIMDIANLGNIIVTPLRKVMQISKENLEMDDLIKILGSDYLLYSSVYLEGQSFDMNSQLINAKNKKSLFGKKLKESKENISKASEQISSEILSKLGLKSDFEIAFEGKQERFNKAYENREYQKALDIINPAKRERGLTVNVKGDLGFNRITGTLTDDFYNIFNDLILPKIKEAPFDIGIDIHSSNEKLPANSIFQNNLDMTVSVARNMETYIKNLKLNNKVYVYGVGDIMPRAIDSIRLANKKWNSDMITPEFIDLHNNTSKKMSRNNRITITFLKENFD